MSTLSRTRAVTIGAPSLAGTRADLLDQLAVEWLAQVEHSGGAVRAAGRRAAHALVRVAGIDSQDRTLALTVTASPDGTSRATGLSRLDVERGLAELRAAALVVERGGALVLEVGSGVGEVADAST